MRSSSSTGVSSAAVIVLAAIVVVLVAALFISPFGILGGRTGTPSSTSSESGSSGSTALTSSSETVSTSTQTSPTTKTSTTSQSTQSSTATTSSSSSDTSQSGSSIQVSSEYANGTSIPGVYVELASNQVEKGTGYTPVSFPTAPGQNYSVIVSDSTGLYFNHWQGGFTSRVFPVTGNGSTIGLVAVFTQSPEPPPNTPYSISVNSEELNGTSIQGYLIDVRVDGYHIQSGFTPVTFKDLEPGVQYQVVAYWAGNQYFRNFGGGDLNRYRLVTFNSTGATSVSFSAYYEYVPPGQGATLNIIAELPNGTLLGTTFNNSNYIQHTPGMWLTITPQGSGVPYTGSYTGGSILPFMLPGGRTYSVQMTLSYGNFSFSRWQDTGATNATRSLFLNGNTTLVAIYVQS